MTIEAPIGDYSAYINSLSARELGLEIARVFKGPEPKRMAIIAKVKGGKKRGIPSRSSKLHALIARDGLACCWCGVICDLKASVNTDLCPTIEHVIRKADGGSNDFDNLKVACWKCNNSRHSKPRRRR